MSRAVRAQLQKTRAELERDVKERDRQKLRELRTAIEEARRAEPARVRDVRRACADERARITADAKKAREALRESIARMRSEAKNICKVRETDTRAETGARIAQAVALLEHEIGHQQQLRAWTRPMVCRVRPGERKGESDCEVRANLEDAGLRAVWEAQKSRIKGTARMSRTEAFLQWAHDHPADVARIQYAAEDAAVAELVKQEAKLRRALEQPGRYRKKSAAELAVILEGVPF